MPSTGHAAASAPIWMEQTDDSDLEWDFEGYTFDVEVSTFLQFAAYFIHDDRYYEDLEAPEPCACIMLSHVAHHPGIFYVWQSFLELLRRIPPIDGTPSRCFDPDDIPPCKWSLVRSFYESLARGMTPWEYESISDDFHADTLPQSPPDPDWESCMSEQISAVLEQRRISEDSSGASSYESSRASTAEPGHGLDLLGAAALAVDEGARGHMATGSRSVRSTKGDPFFAGPLSRSPRQIRPDDSDVPRARARAQQRRRDLTLEGDTREDAAWAVEALQRIRSCPALNYFDLIRQVLPLAPDDRVRFEWCCRCCGDRFNRAKGETDNLVTHLYHCSRGLTPIGDDLRPWDLARRAPRKEWKRAPKKTPRKDRSQDVR
ncbi:hypothetical protein V8E36_005020 [Tilletia maclaganii]